LNLECRLDARHDTSPKASDKLWIPSNVSVDVIKIDRLPADGKLGRLALSFALRPEDQNSENLITL
jgi:hypothetical protein